MNSRSMLRHTVQCITGVLGMLMTVMAYAQASVPLALAYTVPLPDVRGRIDHLAIDVDDARLFVAALGNDTVEVVDLHARTRTDRLNGLRNPQGIGYVPDAKRLFVANAGGGVDVFEGWPLRRVGQMERLDDADNVRYDAAAARIYVGYGHAIAVVGVQTHDVLGSIDLPGHPESFQLEAPGSRIFVNVPSARQIAIVDRDKRAVIGQWTIDDASANFPMALDREGHRLFVATRRPASLLVYDTQRGARIASLRIGGDADDLFFDARRKRIYVICGEGVVDVVQQKDADHYASAGRMRTARGARTGLFANDVLYVAVPAHDQSHAEIRAYSVE